MRRLHVGLRDFRDKHVAHLLAQSNLEKKGKVVMPKYGHERELLDKTIEVTSELYYGICDASFHWPTAWESSKYCADALLSRAAFNIVR